MKSLDTSISKNNGQSVDYRELLEHDGAKLRITIRSDSYNAQCYARVHHWTDNKWTFVESIAASVMVTDTGLAYKPNMPTKAAFMYDRKELIRLAKLVLS